MVTSQRSNLVGLASAERRGTGAEALRRLNSYLRLVFFNGQQWWIIGDHNQQWFATTIVACWYVLMICNIRGRIPLTRVFLWGWNHQAPVMNLSTSAAEHSLMAYVTGASGASASDSAVLKVQMFGTGARPGCWVRLCNPVIELFLVTACQHQVLMSSLSILKAIILSAATDFLQSLCS